MSKKNKTALAICLILGMVGLIGFDLLIAPRRAVEEPRENLSANDSFVPLPLPPQEPIVTPAPVAASTTTPPPIPAPAPAPQTPEIRKHKVQQGDSLWKIAAKYDTLKPTQMMEKIVQANRDKLQSKETPLKLGWELVVPR